MQNAKRHSAFYILLSLISGLAGEIHTQTLEGPLVHLGQDYGGVDIAASQLAQLIHGELGNGVGGSGDG